MVLCLLGKILSSLLAVVFISSGGVVGLYLQAFLIGVLPIWSEVFVSFLLKYEPAREKQKNLLLIDAIVDGLVFVIIPVGWLWFALNPGDIFLFPLLCFLGAGIYRLVRFLKGGLSDRGYFQGLPVTYTGYVWLPLSYLCAVKLSWLAIVILLVLSFLMATKKEFIKASR
ncbi:MAG: hypothetical protein ACM3MG_07365 [Bacillota bacterium]